MICSAAQVCQQAVRLSVNSHNHDRRNTSDGAVEFNFKGPRWRWRHGETGHRRSGDIDVHRHGVSAHRYLRHSSNRDVRPKEEGGGGLLMVDQHTNGIWNEVTYTRSEASIRVDPLHPLRAHHLCLRNRCCPQLV